MSATTKAAINAAATDTDRLQSQWEKAAWDGDVVRMDAFAAEIQNRSA